MVTPHSLHCDECDHNPIHMLSGGVLVATQPFSSRLRRGTMPRAYENVRRKEKCQWCVCVFHAGRHVCNSQHYPLAPCRPE